MLVAHSHVLNSTNGGLDLPIRRVHPRLRLRARGVVLERHRRVDMRVLSKERKILARAVLALDGPIRRDDVDDGGRGGSGDAAVGGAQGQGLVGLEDAVDAGVRGPDGAVDGVDGLRGESAIKEAGTFCRGILTLA